MGATLSTGTTEVHHGYAVRDPDGDEHVTEVVVTGPLEAPETLEARAARPEPVTVQARRRGSAWPSEVTTTTQ